MRTPDRCARFSVLVDGSAMEFTRTSGGRGAKTDRVWLALSVTSLLFYLARSEAIGHFLTEVRRLLSLNS